MKDQFECTFPGCSKIYVNSAILKRHCQAFHSTVNKFQCKVCNKSLASRQNLKEHSYIHTGEKPYCCKEQGCKMSFRQGTHLSAHKKMHMRGEWTISLESLLRKLSQMNDFEDNLLQNTNILGLSQPIILPTFNNSEKVLSLPSLF